jgi:hypothetical protein
MKFQLLFITALFAASMLPGAGADTLNTITVEAQREHEALEKRVDNFVAGVMVHYSDQSLARWNQGVCPLVAGLPKDQGEFMLARLSQIASTAGVQLGPPDCRANLYVVVTRDPELLLKKWRRRDMRMYNDRNGERPIQRFLNTPRPIRVWYNTGSSDADGSSFGLDALPGGVGNTSVAVATNNTGQPPTRLSWYDVEAFTSVIVIVDSTRVKGFTFGELADYIGLVGLVRVRADSDAGGAPSILHLFAKSGDIGARGLSDWDLALLKSLYGTPQSDVMQMSEIRTGVLHSIAP